MTTISAYLTVANNLDRWRGVAAKTPDVANDTAYFKANIGKATTAEALLKDRRLFNYAMKAFGLGDRTYAIGLMRKVLEQGVTDSKALANTLNDSSIRAFAAAFDYKGGAAAVGSANFVQNVTDRYVEQAMESQQGAKNAGVELALYFRQRAPQVTSVYGVLADKKLLQVVQTALDISPNTSAQPIDTQARLLKSKLNLADFADTKKLENFIARFAAQYDMQNPGADSAGDVSANALLYGASFAGSDTPIGVDLTLLLRRQNAARGY
jgi:Protein of unknown function (DUF1217)